MQRMMNQSQLQELDMIAFEIGRSLRLFGLTVLQCKEKWGQVRVYVYWGYVKRELPFESVFIWYQNQIYRLIYKYYLKKYPQYADNIISGADYPDLIGVKRETTKGSVP